MVSTYEHANHVLDGRLDEVLRDLRANGDSYDSIAKHLQSLGIPVSRQSIFRWVRDLDTNTAEAVAS